MNVLYYALGGGRGHATRSRLLGQLLSHHARVHFLLPERLRQWAQGLEASFCSAENLSRSLTRLLRDFKPDLLLVDTFPRGILGELSTFKFPCQAWLIARWLNPQYALRPEIINSLKRYQVVLGCEYNPWRIYNLGPVVAPMQTAQACDYLWIGSGPLEQQQQMASWLTHKAQLVAPELGLASSHLSALMAGARLVISAAGYNTYQEILQAGTPVVFWPQARLYDQQWLRAQGLLGSKPRAWWRCVENFAGLQQALADFEREQPVSAGAQTPSSQWRQCFAQLL